MRALVMMLVCSAAVAAEPLYTYDFEAEDAAEGWRHKTNTTVDVRPPDPLAGQGAMRFVIDPTDFSYGWINRTLPEIDFASLAGVHGFYRAAQGVRGQLTMHICLQTEGAELSYFRGDLGKLSDSDSQWIEFYAALRDLRYERGPIRTLRPEALKREDLIQFIASVEGGKPVAIDLDEVQFLSAEDTAEVARRCAQAARARLLQPKNEITGPGHPRLFFTADQLPEYRAKATAGDERQAAYERLLELAEGLLKSYNAEDPLASIYEFVATSEAEGVAWRGPFEGRIVACSYPIEVLGAAYQLTGDERFGDHGATALVNAAKRLTTDEAFLGRGFYYSRTFYVRALAFGYDWLWDRLTPEERRTVKITLMGFVRDIHEQSQTAGWGRRPLHRVWNWDPGLMGACGVGMLALEGETRLAEQAILFDCRRHLRDYLTLGIDPDGCGHEGPNYLGYGIGAGVEFVEALRQQGRGDLFTETNYRLIPAWLISETLPDGKRWNNLSDCGHGQGPYPVYLYACGRFAELARQDPPIPGERWSCLQLQRPLPYLAQFSEAPGPKRISYGALAGLMGWAWQHGPGAQDPAGYEARTALAHVLFYEPCTPVQDPGTLLPLGLHFRGRGLVVSRTGFGPEDLHLAIEAGPHAAGHDQSDKGTFTLYAYGGDLVIDSGYGNDGDPEKSGSSFAHNVVLIDGQGQPMRYHNQSSGHITGFRGSDLLDWTRVDAREAWGVRYDRDWTPTPTTPVERAERTFILVRPANGLPPYLVVFDDIAKDQEEHAYTWQWHIPPSMRFELGEGLWSAVPWSPVEEVLSSSPEGPAGSATFPFSVAKAGRYVLYGLVRAAGPALGKSDSFFVTVDDGERLLWDLKTGGQLSWDAVMNRGDAEPRVFELAAGEHTIRLEVRERQAELGRWLILPEGAEPPLDPTATPEGAVRLDLDDAVMDEPGLERRSAKKTTAPEATLDVFPVHPAQGEVSTGWFLTSREGAHPRLQYTVRAADPHFVMVLVPRREGIEQPHVSALTGAGGVGATVSWSGATDHIVFGWQKASLGKVELEGTAAFVRERDEKVSSWALLDGTRLAFDGAELHRSDRRVVRIEGEP